MCSMTNASQSSQRGKSKTVAINVQLPEAVHRKLRVKAINQQMTLAEAVAAAVQAWTR